MAWNGCDERTITPRRADRDVAGAAAHRAGRVDAARDRDRGALEDEAAAGPRRAGTGRQADAAADVDLAGRLDRQACGRPCSRCRRTPCTKQVRRLEPPAKYTSLAVSVVSPARRTVAPSPMYTWSNATPPESVALSGREHDQIGRESAARRRERSASQRAERDEQGDRTAEPDPRGLWQAFPPR